MKSYIKSAWIHWSVFIFAALAVLSRAWVAEDAYITFRAVENLFGGYGLVFNPGERTEVFSHPLWMMFLVLIKGVGLPLHFGTILTGILISLTSFYILIFRPFSKISVYSVFPLAALIFAGISGLRDFATAGMEFSLVFLLFTLFSELILKDEKKEMPFFESKLFTRPFLSSTILILLYLTRPELSLLYIYYSFFMAAFLLKEIFHYRSDYMSVSRHSAESDLITDTQSHSITAFKILKTAVMWSLPFILFAGSYHLFRFLYFEDLFPNTYYAKSGLSSYYSQGFKYLAYTLIWSPGLWILIVFLGMWLGINALHLYKSERSVYSQDGILRVPFLPLSVEQVSRNVFYSWTRDMGAVLLLVFYVVRMGGDFMSFRFLLPEIVFFVLIAERILHTEFKIDSDFALRWKSSAALFIMILIFWPIPLHIGYVADERRVYTENSPTSQIQRFVKEEFPWGEKANRYKTLQACLGYEPFWISNSQAQAKCMEGVGLGYFGVNAGPKVLIFDEQGLPNEEVAKAKIYTRFRPGYEKYLTPTQIIEKGILFCSSGEPQYDQIMNTAYGIVISFNPEIVLSLPDRDNRLKELLRLKKEDSVIVSRLEKRYKITIEELIKKSNSLKNDPVLKIKESCWGSG